MAVAWGSPSGGEPTRGGLFQGFPRTCKEERVYVESRSEFQRCKAGPKLSDKMHLLYTSAREAVLEDV